MKKVKFNEDSMTKMLLSDMEIGDYITTNSDGNFNDNNIFEIIEAVRQQSFDGNKTFKKMVRVRAFNDPSLVTSLENAKFWRLKTQ